MKINMCNVPINGIMDKTQVFISKNEKEHLRKYNTFFLLKTINKLGLEEVFLNLIDIY